MIRNKIKSVALLAFLITASATLPVRSQIIQKSHVDSLISKKAASTKVMYIDGRPSDPDEIKRDRDSLILTVSKFYYDQFRHFQDPDAPYFLFMSKSAGLSMGIGGSVRMRAYYDWNGAMPTPSFAPSTIPIPADPLAMRHFSTTPAGTGLFFRVIGYNQTIGDYQLYIETDFTGYLSRGLNLKKAYAMVRDFTIGYATSTFSDPAAQPIIIDAAGNNNKFSTSSVLVRYMPCFRKKWHVGVSIETPSTFINPSSPDAKPRAEWLPDFAALGQYEWAPGQHVRLSGILRTLPYRDLTTNKNHNVLGWGLHLSSVGRPATPLTLYANLSIGRGIAGLGGDLQYGRYDLIADPIDQSMLYAPLSFGWCGGIQYNFCPDFLISLAASQMNLYSRKHTSGDTYRTGTFASATAYWNILPRIAAAAELDFGRRRDVSGLARNAWRANLMCSFSF